MTQLGTPLLLQAERRGMNSGSVSDKSLSFTGESLCGSLVPHTSRFTRETETLSAFSPFRFSDSDGERCPCIDRKAFGQGAKSRKLTLTSRIKKFDVTTRR